MIANFSVSTDGDQSSNVTLRCSACSIMVNLLDIKWSDPKIYKEFKDWDRPKRLKKLKNMFKKSCDTIRGLKFVQVGNRSERVWAEMYHMLKTGTNSQLTMNVETSSQLAAICENYLEEDLPDLVDRMSNYINVEVAIKGKMRKQRIVDFKIREEVCIEQFRFCSVKRKNSTKSKVEEDDWDWDEELKGEL